jgi:hypothetical protein
MMESETEPMRISIRETTEARMETIRVLAETVRLLAEALSVPAAIVNVMGNITAVNGATGLVVDLEESTMTTTSVNDDPA